MHQYLASTDPTKGTKNNRRMNRNNSKMEMEVSTAYANSVNSIRGTNVRATMIKTAVKIAL